VNIVSVVPQTLLAGEDRVTIVALPRFDVSPGRKACVEIVTSVEGSVAVVAPRSTHFVAFKSLSPGG
jgi:hypothetical protein